MWLNWQVIWIISTPELSTKNSLVFITISNVFCRNKQNNTESLYRNLGFFLALNILKSVPVHVSIGGEGLTTHWTFVGSLSTVDQHVAIQRAGRAQRLSADATRVVAPSDLCVMLKDEPEDILQIFHISFLKSLERSRFMLIKNKTPML